MPRKSVARQVEAEVLVLCRRRCCICYGLTRDISIKAGQIAHLDGDPSNDNPDNLAFLCFEHHDQYDSRTSQSKGLTPAEVRRFRKDLHEIIEDAWKQPVSFDEGQPQATEDISGHYVRETEFESAELDVKALPGDRVRVTGLALWGRGRRYGPNIGQLDFEASVKGRRAEFLDRTPQGDTYALEIRFDSERLIAKEHHYVVGYFGLDVSFEGEYRKVRKTFGRLREAFERILLRVLPSISDTTGARIDEIGLHVWLAPAPSSSPTAVLGRAARIRLSDSTPSKPRVWQRGEGVVGRCWDEQTDVAINLTDQRYNVESEDEWLKVPTKMRLGLDLTEFMETTWHFRAICASPIVPRDEAVGCISLNFDRDCPISFEGLWTTEVKRLLRKAAEDVAIVLRAAHGAPAD